MDDLAIKLAEIEQRVKSNTHRLDDVERQNDALMKLATSVEVLAVKQDAMSGSLNRLEGKVGTLEARPAKRWEAAISAIISALVGVLIGAIVSGKLL